MSSYPKRQVVFTAGVAGEIVMADQAFGQVGRVVFQVVTAGGWNDAIRVYRRIQGSGRLENPAVAAPWVRSAYRNESGQADVNNTTDVTTANIFSVMADGTDIKLEQQASGDAGTATVLFHGLAG